MARPRQGHVIFTVGHSTRPLEEFAARQRADAIDYSSSDPNRGEKARALYEKALADEGSLMEAEDRAAITYLVGELSRRLGDSAKAREYYDKAIRYKYAPEWVRTYAQEQSALVPDGN